MIVNIFNIVIIVNIVKMIKWVRVVESGWIWMGVDECEWKYVRYVIFYTNVEAQEPRSSNKAVLAWWVAFEFA